MTDHRHRLLGGGAAANPSSNSTVDSPEPDSVDSDFVVILASLLCALICVLGLVAVARCACIRRLSAAAGGVGSAVRTPANKGLRKKALRSLPKQTYTAEQSGRLGECAICLAEFALGEEIRVLPQCGHGFHVACIDMWLASHSSCPSCRRLLVVGRCQTCGGVPASGTAGAGAGGPASVPAGRREDDVIRFLP